MRPSVLFIIVLGAIAAAQLGVIGAARQRLQGGAESEEQMRAIVATYGLSDLCIATDARYVRNPAVSDRAAPFMDHPGSLEHFPTGSFWIPEP